jgi:hypothetical protein
MGGDIRQYLQAYWAAGRAAYSQAKAIWGFLLALISALALLGFSWASPSILPIWAAPAWFALYLIPAVLVYVPYRMWKQQRGEIAQLTLPQGPIPDMTIRELFYFVGEGTGDILDPHTEGWRDVGIAILDKLSTGQLIGWGRLHEVRIGTPLVPIEQSYWAIAGWTYYFLPEKKDSLSDEVHVWPRSANRDSQRYYDVHVNRAQALRIWRRAKK